MAIVLGFVPWIVYWVLVGNAPFKLAVGVAFAITVLIELLHRLRKERAHTLEIGNLAVFAVLTVAAFTVPTDVLERWLQPLSSAGLFLIALVGVLAGHPFVREYAEDTVDEATARSEGFKSVTAAMTWMWVGAFGIMLASTLIPPVVDGDATIRDMENPLSILCYWVIPFTVLGVAGAISAVFPPWFEKRSAAVDQRSAARPTVVAQAPPPADVATDLVHIDAPPDSRMDEAFGVRVDLSAAGKPHPKSATVTTSGHDLYGHLWRSKAELVVPPSGVLDLAVAVPSPEPSAASDWTTADAGAPIWAMTFADENAVPEVFIAPTEPWQVTIEVHAAGGVLARRTVLRRGADPGVRFEPTRVDGRPGILVLPSGEPPAGGWPAVACFGGSEGGYESQLAGAALLASHGYAALAQAWISGPDAEAGISQVPLERFAGALALLTGRAEVDPTRVAAMGLSRGSEGLLAALGHGLAPAPRAVILVSPSSVSWQAMGASGEIPDTGSWTAAGLPVPWLPVASGVLMRQLVRNAWTVGRDAAHRRPSLLRVRPAYENSLATIGSTVVDDGGTVQAAGADPGPAAASAAVLDATTVASPLLMLCGTDDQVWPAGPMAATLAAQRHAAGCDRDDELVVYSGAGHLIRLGLLPTDAQWTGGIALGGSREGQARAQADATARVLAFLATHTAAVTSAHGSAVR